MHSNPAKTSHRGLDRFGVIKIGRVLGGDNIFKPEPVRGAEDRSQVPRVVQTVQGQSEPLELPGGTVWLNLCNRQNAAVGFERAEGFQILETAHDRFKGIVFEAHFVFFPKFFRAEDRFGLKTGIQELQDAFFSFHDERAAFLAVFFQLKGLDKLRFIFREHGGEGGSPCQKQASGSVSN